MRFVILSALIVSLLASTASITHAGVGFDLDGDGVPDANEIVYGSDTSKIDSDSDGLLDGVENADQNGFRSANETDATNPDTDGDGIADGKEDQNRNGKIDRGETSPIDVDGDADGIKDGADNCPLEKNSRQSDWDFDGKGDVCDGDSYLTLYLRSEEGEMLSVAKIRGRHYYRAQRGKVIVFRGRIVPKESDGNIKVQVRYRYCRKHCRYKVVASITTKKQGKSRYIKGYRLRRVGQYLFKSILEQGSNNDRSSTVVRRVRVR